MSNQEALAIWGRWASVGHDPPCFYLEAQDPHRRPALFPSNTCSMTPPNVQSAACSMRRQSTWQLLACHCRAWHMGTKLSTTLQPTRRIPRSFAATGDRSARTSSGSSLAKAPTPPAPSCATLGTAECPAANSRHPLIVHVSCTAHRALFGCPGCVAHQGDALAQRSPPGAHFSAEPQG